MASENLAKNREVSEEEARAFAHFNNLPYIETSSKTGKIWFFCDILVPSIVHTPYLVSLGFQAEIAHIAWILG